MVVHSRPFWWHDRFVCHISGYLAPIKAIIAPLDIYDKDGLSVLGLKAWNWSAKFYQTKECGRDKAFFLGAPLAVYRTMCAIMKKTLYW